MSIILSRYPAVEWAGIKGGGEREIMQLARPLFSFPVVSSFLLCSFPSSPFVLGSVGCADWKLWLSRPAWAVVPLLLVRLVPSSPSFFLPLTNLRTSIPGSEARGDLPFQEGRLPTSPACERHLRGARKEFVLVKNPIKEEQVADR